MSDLRRVASRIRRLGRALAYRWGGQADPEKRSQVGLSDTDKMRDLDAFKNVFEGITPWRGPVPRTFTADFLGALTDAEFLPLVFKDPEAVGGGYVETSVPKLGEAKSAVEAELWFEAADWVMAAREARDRFAMITLGANYGAQAVGAVRALQSVNPLPYKLVAVEPVAENLQWLRRHLQNNGIDYDAQWIVPLAISDKIDPVFFPMGGPGVGAQNCYSTNEKGARVDYAQELIKQNKAAEALRNLLINNTTGLRRDLVPGLGIYAEIKLISAVTLQELLGPFDRVDLLEADIQQSEILVFPPFIDLLRRKVRRIHIGTHGEDVHEKLHRLFAEAGWDIVFSFAPNRRHQSSLGAFEVNDGVLTVRNPNL